MKLIAALLIFISTFFIQNKVVAQAPTVNGAEYNYLYKLNKEQVRWMIDSPWISHDNWVLTHLVDSAKMIQGLGSLVPSNRQKGYFMRVGVSDLSINTQLLILQPFFVTVQETNGEWWFILRDTLQNIVKNGQLTLIKSKKTAHDTLFAYDSSCLCYPVPKLVSDNWFVFEADGEFYYMYMQSPYKKVKHKWWKFWKENKVVAKDQSPNYTYRARFGRRVINWFGGLGNIFEHKPTLMSMDPGYMVINQPKFKHDDTLKMKAFLVNRKGKPMRETLLLTLITQENGVDKILFEEKIKPISRGAYTYNFAIPDTFALDQNYSLHLQEIRMRKRKINREKKKINTGKLLESTYFRVEEYELNKISYTWEDKKPEYYRGKSIWLYAKAVDANNLPVPDAKVQLKLKIRRINDTYDSLITLPQEVFTNYFDTTLMCSPDGLTPIELPGYLIPNADIEVTGEMKFTNADNTPGMVYHNFNVLANSRRHYIVEDSNGLRAGYLVQGSDTIGKTARWRVIYSQNIYKETKVTLPYYHNWEAGAQMYQLYDSEGRLAGSYAMPKYPPKQPQININKTHDSLHISFNNPLGLEIAYRIYNDEKLLYKGAAPQLNYHIKLGGLKPVRVRYTYSWAGGIYTNETVGWVKEKQLNINIEQPKTVYPGQEIAVDITVTDYKNRPVNKTNLTAYSINTELDGILPPQMPYYGKSYGSKLKTKLLNYPLNWFGNQNFNVPEMDNSTFHKLSLYRFPYYRLLYAPKAIGVEYDSLTEGKTQLSLFAMDRKPDKTRYKHRGIHAAWVDGELVHVNATNALRNAYTVSEGQHSIKIRTAFSMCEFDVNIKKGMRNLVGINVDSVYLNNAITITKFEHDLTKEEKEAYNPNNKYALFIAGDYNTDNTIRQNNNTRLLGGYIRQGNAVYQISLFSNTPYYVKPYTYQAIIPLKEGEVELILPNDDTAITFNFNPAYMYLFDGKTVKPYIESYEELKLQYIAARSFNDTVVEIPPFAKTIKEEQEKKAPKTNTVKVYQARNVFDHPMARNYQNPYLYNYNNKRNVVRVEKAAGSRIAKIWLFNNDSLELSSINNNNSWGKFEYIVTAGNYTLLLATDTNSYKILRNFRVDTGYNYYYKPAIEGYTAYDSLELLPYVELVKYLNRGPVPPFYKAPVRVNVKLNNEPTKLSEKIIGEFSINGKFINNALVVVEDGNGSYITAGITNGNGFYQIPVLPGTYRLKIYTPQWDMFYVDKAIVTKNYNTIAHLTVVGYTPNIATLSYAQLPAKQRSEQPTATGRQPQYQNVASGNCIANCSEIRGIVINAQTGEAVPYANITLHGTNIGTITDDDGSYRLKNLPVGEYSLIITYEGYQTQKIIDIHPTANQLLYLNIELKENIIELTTNYTTTEGMDYYDSDEVQVVDNYNLTSKKDMMSVQTMSAPVQQYSVQSSVADVVIESRGGRVKALAYYVDGVRIVGDEKLTETDLVQREDEDQRLQQMLGDENAMRVRKDFRDYAYWIPNLLTNRKGKAGFSVRIPDNQTQWITYVPAMDYKCKTGLGIAYMRAYKPITANLSLPTFMVAGDNLQIFGKTVNYTSDSVVLNTSLKINDLEIFNRPMGVRYFETAYHTYQPQKAGIANFLYQIKMDNGYTDGDLRSLRVIENGLLINEGETRILKGEANITLLPQQGYKNRQVLLSNRKAELLLAEIEQLKNYQYGCVEQTASKLKALLLEKQLLTALNQPFTGEREIKAILKRLEKYQNKDGSWGWWDKTPANDWMTMYATDALNRAQKAGYRTTATLQGANYINARYNSLSIQNKLLAVKLFLVMGYKNMTREVAQFEGLNMNLQDRLLLLQAKQIAGQKINTDSIAAIVRLIGDDKAAWGEALFNIYVNEINTSAIAYQILRKEGNKHADLLKKVRNYFLTQAPSNRNTIQSATYLETFLQDIITEDAKRNELLPVLKLNGKEDNRASIKINLGEEDTLSISKQGSELFYLYAWQKFVANPNASNSIFKIRTTLLQGNRLSDTVEVGKPLTLQVSVSIDKARDYVMIEIPIPAGFSYESKAQSHQYGEVHREYFEDKVSIFFTSINQGHYFFELKLLPKFKGTATLLPVHVEEMYFPINSGNNTKRIITIK